jgi:hypothetical protein
MKHKYISAWLLGGLMMACGCSKYTDIKTQGSLVPGDIQNYRYLLNYTSTYEIGGGLQDYAAAEADISDSTQQAQISTSSYYLYIQHVSTWSAPIFPFATDKDPDWNSYYGRIFNCNVIINEVPGSTGGTDSAKAELIGEALVHRADAYINLVNEYAKPYNAATAGSDLGVPLVLDPSLTQQLPRASIAAVYSRVEADLKQAAIALPRSSNINTLPNKAAAYALLARTYLLMGNYTNAGLYADSALILKNTLNDLGTTPTLPRKLTDPEIILEKVAGLSVGYGSSMIRLSDELLGLFDTRDMRYQLFTAAAEDLGATGYTGRFFTMERVNGDNRNIGPSVPEMILVKAESLARAGDANGAMDQVNILRQKRFAAADYVAMSAGSANDAIVKVIEERKREFMCRMLPWMDQRRLKDDPLFSKTYTRTWLGQTYTLEPSSNRYVFPISQYVINLNPEIEQNP